LNTHRKTPENATFNNVIINVLVKSKSEFSDRQDKMPWISFRGIKFRYLYKLERGEIDGATISFTHGRPNGDDPVS